MKTLDEIKQMMVASDTAQADKALKELLAAEPDNLQAKMLYGTCCQTKKWFLLIVATFSVLPLRADLVSPIDFLIPKFSIDNSVWIAFLVCSAIVIFISVRKKSPFVPVWLACLASAFLGVAMAMRQYQSFLGILGIFNVGFWLWVVATLRLVVRKKFKWAVCLTVFLIYMPILLFIITRGILYLCLTSTQHQSSPLS